MSDTLTPREPTPQGAWAAHLARLRACTACPGVQGPSVLGEWAPQAGVYLFGQAPGTREQATGRPFVHTAGKTLFKWFATIGAEEMTFRRSVYMAAVLRCFPGKIPGRGGDRKPSPEEIERCDAYARSELELLRPRLILPVGRMAIERFIPCPRLDAVVGRAFSVEVNGDPVAVIPLPHPSGASPWHRMEPGKTLLTEALRLIAAHPAWREVFPVV